MTVAPLAPTGSSRLRIAITSPDIVARIRQVFADRNLEVDIVRTPYVEVVVRPASGPGSGPVPGQTSAARSTMRPPGSGRLVAEYRLIVVGTDPDTDGAAEPVPVPRASRGRPGPARAADPASSPAALSRRQHEVMALVSRGARNAEIADRLRVSEKTVKNHINRIFRALGATNRVEAVVRWQLDG